MKRVCSRCGVITANRRCATCARAFEAERQRRTKGNYDSAWRKLVARAIAEHPWCAVCRHPGSPENPLTGDHIVPRKRGGKNERGNIAVLCRVHNSSKGARQESGAGSA